MNRLTTVQVVPEPPFPNYNICNCYLQLKNIILQLIVGYQPASDKSIKMSDSLTPQKEL